MILASVFLAPVFSVSVPQFTPGSFTRAAIEFARTAPRCFPTLVFRRGHRTPHDGSMRGPAIRSGCEPTSASCVPLCRGLCFRLGRVGVGHRNSPLLARWPCGSAMSVTARPVLLRRGGPSRYCPRDSARVGFYCPACHMRGAYPVNVARMSRISSAIAGAICASVIAFPFHSEGALCSRAHRNRVPGDLSRFDPAPASMGSTGATPAAA